MTRMQRLMLALILAVAVGLIAALPSTALAGGTGECPPTLTTRTVPPTVVYELESSGAHGASVEINGFIARPSQQPPLTSGTGESYEWGSGEESLTGEQYVLLCGTVPLAETGEASELFEMIIENEHSVVICPPGSSPPGRYFWQLYDI